MRIRTVRPEFFEDEKLAEIDDKFEEKINGNVRKWPLAARHFAEFDDERTTAFGKSRRSSFGF